MSAQFQTLPMPSSGAEPHEPSVPALRVTVLSGKQRGRVFVVDRQQVLIGRSPSADVCLEEPTVSQFHVELRARGQGIQVRDRQSRNGVRVGTLLVEQAVVPSGCQLGLGAAAVCVELDQAFTPPRSSATSFGGLVGASRAMQELYAVLERLAGKDIPVLIQGATGTGKEVAARALHAAGPRAEGPVVVLDCTTLPRGVAQSVLFGHKRGAYTDAKEGGVGIFEAAQSGMVFLDEVGDLPLDLQPLLLRVLQERQVTRIGESRPRPVDVQVIAATWRDLQAMVNQGTFREDLYYRLATVPLRMPALSERPDDLPLLIEHFLSRLPAGVTARAMDPEVRDELCRRAYPGNVRELKAVVERLAGLSSGAVIGAEDLALERVLAGVRGKAAPRETELAPFKQAKQSCIEAFERTYLSRLLERAGGRISAAARLAEVERHTLRDLLRKHGLYVGDGEGQSGGGV